MTGLSVVVIGKNNADHIAAVVKNGLQFGDEVIYVDTGSSDGTLKLAENAGARVVDYPMKEFDYSTPRCVGDDHATHHWVFHLDTDESIHPRFIDRIRSAVDHPRYDRYLILQRPRGEQITYQLPRLYDRTKGRHKGLCWELVYPVARQGPLEVLVDHDKDHSAYTAKYPMRLALEKREMRAFVEGKKPETKDELIEAISRIGSKQYLAQHDPRAFFPFLNDVEQYHLRLVERGENDPVVAVETARTYHNLNVDPLAIQALRLLEREHVDYALFWKILAGLAMEANNLPTSLEYVEKAIALDDHSFSRVMQCVALVKLGRKSEAKKALERAMDLLPEDPVHQQLYLELFV